MNTGQLMLIVGAMALLSTGILMMNNSFTNSGQVVLKAKLGINAVSLAASVIQEACGQQFDRASNDSGITTLAQLTPVNQLGMDIGESYPDSVDDFDDYNGVKFVRSIDKSGVYTVWCKVTYVDPANPDVASSTPTWHKKLSVFVSAPEMTDTVRADYIYSYWYFR